MNSNLLASIRSSAADTRTDLLALWKERDKKHRRFCFQDKDVEPDVLIAKGLEKVDVGDSDLLASLQGDIVCRSIA